MHQCAINFPSPFFLFLIDKIIGVLREAGFLLLFFGGLLIAIGLLLVLWGKVNIPYFGRLPGDIGIERNGFSIYFPWVTFLLLSLLLTIVINLLLRLFGR